jgi:tetrahedral aminopeptidase
MDDRIGCVVLIEVLRRMGETPHEVYFVFSVQEEVGLRGARTGAYGLHPEVGIAVDITASGDTPEAPKMAMKLGPARASRSWIRACSPIPGSRISSSAVAREKEIPYQLEVLAAGTTDAAAIQLVHSGVAAGCVSLACRYYHTPSEMDPVAVLPVPGR